MDNDASKPRHAILKVINYRDSSYEKIERHVNYILDRKKSPEGYSQGWYVDCNEALRGLERLYKRYHPKGTRNFKHWIISFGDQSLSLDRAFEVSKGIADYFGKDYPVVLGMHTNTRRVHCHFLQNTVAVRSGKKFSQSLDDFDAFRIFVNEVLEQYKLPLLRGIQKPEVNEDEKFLGDEEINWRKHAVLPYYTAIQGAFVPYGQANFLPPQLTPKNGVAIRGTVNINECVRVLSQGLQIFREYGKGEMEHE